MHAILTASLIRLLAPFHDDLSFFFKEKNFGHLGFLSNFQLDLEAERDPWKSIELTDIKQGICIA